MFPAADHALVEGVQLGRGDDTARVGAAGDQDLAVSEQGGRLIRAGRRQRGRGGPRVGRGRIQLGGREHTRAVAASRDKHLPVPEQEAVALARAFAMLPADDQVPAAGSYSSADAR